MQIIIVIEETNKDGDEKEIFGEVEIDLDELMEKKLKYYTIRTRRKSSKLKSMRQKSKRSKRKAKKIQTIILQPITGKDSFVKEESSLKASLKLKTNSRKVSQNKLWNCQAIPNQLETIRQKIFDDPPTFISAFCRSKFSYKIAVKNVEAAAQSLGGYLMTIAGRIQLRWLV